LFSFFKKKEWQEAFDNLKVACSETGMYCATILDLKVCFNGLFGVEISIFFVVVDVVENRKFKFVLVGDD
jgi:hypothetical protein